MLKEGTLPINVRPYRYPYVQKGEIEKLMAEMSCAILIKANISPYSSPVMLVHKKEGFWHFCVDYRALNQATVLDQFPIPNIDESLDQLNWAKLFTKLDLKLEYHQILIKAEDTHKIAFHTHKGHYEFLVMPFGLSNAPATFLSLQNKIFKGMLRRHVLVFFDDILIYIQSLEAHITHLKEVLEVL